MPAEQEKRFNWFLWLISLSCLAAIASALYFFYYKKDYDFIVEVACNPAEETCFQRDCSNPDDCPPNGLSEFKRYTLNAGDFAMCENEDCENACESGAIKCEPVQCVEDELVGESCTSLEIPTEQE